LSVQTDGALASRPLQ